jgi:alpha-ribazole phosphatase
LKIIFIRHGQTAWNAESRYQGHSDSDLSDAGREQAERAADRLKNEPIAAVYSSDLRRAFDTGKEIASLHGLSVVTDPRLREVAFGEWEGLTVDEIREKYELLYEHYRKDSVTNRAPGGERLEAMQARVVEAVDEISVRHPKETVVIATHGGPIRAFFCHAFDADLVTFRNIGLDNGSITIFELLDSGRWFLEVLNDTLHLGAV